MVDTNKHLRFPSVYHLLKLILVLPIATALVERCFSAMKIVKPVVRNRIGHEFRNDSTIPNDDVIVCFSQNGWP
uniref:HAT C-terminal dimerisation domain-containing protein n=1 Tax=Setaria italica TaxID=4555 RepID=K3YLK3_SETIT